MKKETAKTPNNTPYISLIMGGALAMSQSTALGQAPPPLINGLPPAPPVPENNDQDIDFYATPLPPVPNIIPNRQSSPTILNNSEPISVATPPPINIPVILNNNSARNTNNNTPQKPVNLVDNNSYKLYVLGDNEILLAQVQKIEPKAFIRSGEGVIQVGIFNNKINAEKLSQSLQKQGLRTKILGFSSTTNKPPSSNINLPSRYPRTKGYFVVIPGNEKNLATMMNEIVASGLDKSYISMQDYPRGNHLGIGPFSRRTEAQKWNAYFRSLGMDARLYFGR